MIRLLVTLVVATLLFAVPAQAGILNGKFITNWLPSHTSNDDPLLYPGQPGAAHRHCFLGNTTTNANSTAGSMLNGSTTARIRDNLSAYWVPSAVFPNGDHVCPSSSSAYYGAFGKESTRIAGGQIQPPPVNLGFVTGDANATTYNASRVYWRCHDNNLTLSRPPSSCTKGVSMSFRSPSCWDGKRLMTSNGKDHMSNAVSLGTGLGFACPASHPVAVPQVEMQFNYPIQARLGEDWKLSSDHGTQLKGMSGHMDTWWFWLAQGPEMTKCLNDPRRGSPTSTLCGGATVVGADQKLFDASRAFPWADPIA